jgi:hypothetical protein
MKRSDGRKAYEAMMKFTKGAEPMTESDWHALSWITMLDPDRRSFEPGNCRWAKDAKERASNLAFYRMHQSSSLH